MTDYKKLCAELLSALESWSPGGGGPLESQEAEKEARLIERARAALADEPAAPAPPADGEVAELVAWFSKKQKSYECFGCYDAAAKLTRAAELLQRRVLVPVSANERLPGPGDCDAEGKCWWGRSESHDWSADWTFATHKAVAEFCEFSPQTAWLPAHALPLPEVGD